MKKTINKTLIIIGLTLLFPQLASAADIKINASRETVSVGDQFIANLVVDSQESLNAIEGQLDLSPELSVVKIFSGNSVINFWIEKPEITELGNVIFSGIAPGGFRGVDKNIISIVLEAKQEGLASLSFRNTRVLLGDGIGTEATSNFQPLSIEVTPSSGEAIIETLDDQNPPEDFTPTIESDPTIFNGRYFLVFSTQDKGVGIDRYEVREGVGGDYRVAESPHLLERQELDRKIFVKAIDNAGNEREVIIEPDGYINPWEDYRLFGIILVIIFAIIALGKLWRRNSKT